MHKLWSSSWLLIVLATSTAAQAPIIATTPIVESRTGGAAGSPAQRATTFLAPERVHSDTATRKSRRQIIGAALGAMVGAVPGGTYAFLESTDGCKGLVCDKPRHLWVYPVGGAAIGAVIGALIARF